MRAIWILLACFWFVSSAEAKWLRAESRHFIGYYSEENEKALRAHMERLERFDYMLRAQTGIRDDEGQTKLTVFFVRGVGTVRELYSGSNANVAGFYVATFSGGLAVVPLRTGDEDDIFTADVILFHEYAHHFVAQYYEGVSPAWYAEGFAEFNSTVRFDKEGKPQLGLPAQHRVAALRFGRDVPVRRLLTASVGELERSEGEPFYGRAWALTHYLAFNPQRVGQLQSYYKSINQGEPPLKAAESAFGDIEVLDKELDDYIRKGRVPYQTLKQPALVRGDIVITSLSQGENESMLIKIAMSRGTDPSEAAAQAEKMAKIAAKFHTNPEVLALLAEAECDARHWDASIAAADAALKLNDQTADAHMWKGVAMMGKLTESKETDSAKWRLARSSLIRANRLNTENASPLYFYFNSFIREGVRPTDAAIAGLGKAQSLVPQVAPIRIEYAFALANQKKFAEAYAMLRPLANSPHNSDERKTEVSALMERLKGMEAEASTARGGASQ